MKFSAQEEYGLRCLLQLGRHGTGKSLSIPEISKAEGITVHNTAKLLRLLRRGGFIESERGQAGGYTLARPPEQISIRDVLSCLGGRLFDPGFCERYAGNSKSCNHSVDCSLRSLWKTIQSVVDVVLSQTSLQDLLISEEQQTTRLNQLTSRVGSTFKSTTPSSLESVFPLLDTKSGCSQCLSKVEN